jgi:transcriptional regulator with XRE-family HTH domain
MGTIFSMTREQQAEAAVEFGAMLRRWREINGWTQYTSGNWAAESGIDEIAHSGLSELERGLTKDPRVSLYMALGTINSFVHAQNWRGVTSRRLMDQLKGSRAICSQDGEPWGPAEFFACRAGLLAPPDWLAPTARNPAPVVSTGDAQELCDGWADQARQAVRQSGVGRAGLDRAKGFAPARQRDRWADVLIGLHTYSPEELAGLWSEAESEWLPAQWLAAWKASLPAPSGGGGGQ